MILKSNQGFIALTSVIIISVLLMGMVLTLNAASYLGRSAILNGEYKNRSREIAEACVDAVRLKLAGDISYIGSDSLRITTAFGAELCSYDVDIDPQSNNNKIIRAQTTAQNMYTNVEVKVKKLDLSIINSRELQTCDVQNHPWSCS